MAPPPSSEAIGPQTSVILERGQAIERFVVLGLVGRGGMGEVYAAYDPELDRKIAIKLLHTRADTADGKTRLLREAQAIAKLQHPNVVVIYDVGTFGESVFIAMEFVEGRTVSGWLHAAPRTRREIMDVYLAAGRGLAAAHAAGLVHRDFKPDNVMVTNDGQVRVMDFGLARQIGEQPDEARLAAAALPPSTGNAVAETLDPGYDPEATADLGRGAAAAGVSRSGKYLSIKLTQTGAMLGTPAYMAPEQFAAQATEAGTDQFSFCVALYEGLFGARPFAGETFLALMTSVTTGAVSPPPPKARVPAWMRKVLLRGLQPRPEARFPSMTALLTALQTDPTVRARRSAAAIGIMACLGVAAVGARRVAGTSDAMCRGATDRLGGIWEPRGVPSPRKDAIHRAFVRTGRSYAEQAFVGASRLLDGYVERWSRMYAEACEATHVRGEQSAEVLDLRMSCLQERLSSVHALGDVFAQADPTVVENAVAAAGALQVLDLCADVPTLRAVVKPPADEATRHRVEALRAEKAHFVALRDAGQCAAADKLVGPLLEDVRKVNYSPLLAETLFAAAYLSDSCSDQQLGLKRYREAFSVALAAHHDEVAAEVAACVPGLLVGRFGRTEEARVWVDIARAMVKRLGSRPLLDSWIDNIDAVVLIAEGRLQPALEVAARGVSMAKKVRGDDHRDVFIALGNLGSAQEAARNYPAALETFAAARDGFARVLGAEHPLVAMQAVNVGEVLNILKRHGEARAAYAQALDIFRKAAADPSFVAYALTGVGIALLGEGRAAESVAPLEEALLIRTKEPPIPEHLGETRFALARALWSRPREGARARGLARQALADYAEVKATATAIPDVAAWLRAPSTQL